jgi:hypothetical protein
VIEHAYNGNRSQDTCWVHTKDGMCRRPIEEHIGGVRTPEQEPLTTEEVTEAVSYGAIADASGEDFDAWLDKIRAEAGAAALEDAASKVRSRFEHGWLTTAEADKVAEWLRWLKEKS